MSDETPSLESGGQQSAHDGATKAPRTTRGEVVVSALVGGLAAALVSGVFTLWGVDSQGEQTREQQAREFAEERELRLQDLRRPVYDDFLDKANEWAVAQRARAKECKPGTDEPRTEGGTCTVSYLGGLQAARYELREANNAMSTVESQDGEVARVLLLTTVPSSAPREPGPAEGLPSSRFTEAYTLFLDQATCDTNPEPDKAECSKLRTKIRDTAAAWLADPDY